MKTGKYQSKLLEIILECIILSVILVFTAITYFKIWNMQTKIAFGLALAANIIYSVVRLITTIIQYKKEKQ